MKNNLDHLKHFTRKTSDHLKDFNKPSETQETSDHLKQFTNLVKNITFQVSQKKTDSCSLIGINLNKNKLIEKKNSNGKI